MSVSATEGSEPEAIELPTHGDAAFGALMDALAPEPDEGGAAAPAAGAAPAADGADAGAAAPGAAGAAGAPDGAGDGAAGRPTAGDPAGAPAAAADAGADGGAGGGAAAGAEGAEGAAAGGAEQSAAAGGAAGVPAGWTADAATLVPKFGELSTALEESATQAYRSQAFEEVQAEHGQYFEALNKHPRLLVGQDVPALGREGTETLRTTEDAREWQEAVKSLLVSEINDRAGRQMEESADFLATVHASIDLFANNPDLIPGTKGFDVELANRFATLAAPYELRVDEKLQGYSIPVQPIIDQLRQQISAERAKQAAPAAPATPAPPVAGAAPPAAPSPPVDPPQAGIASKAGNGSSSEDFSTLFGTIGLPNFTI